MSRLSESIIQGIQSAPTENARWIGRLRLAAYRARTGAEESARTEIEKARQDRVARDAPEVVASINLAEAILAYFDGRADEGLTKVRRGYAIASAAKFVETATACAVWEAHFCRNLRQWDGLFSALVHCMGTVANNDEVTARLAVVLADSLLELGDESRADRWYRAARHYALKCGDDSLIAALIYNRAVLSTFNVRLRDAAGHQIVGQETFLLIQEASARSFEDYSRVIGLRWFLEVLKGQLLVMQGRFEDARPYLQSANPESLGEAYRGIAVVRDADLLYCEAMSARAVSRRAVEELAARLKSLPDPADAALAAHRLAQCSLCLSEEDLGKSLCALRDSFLADCATFRAETLRKFDHFLLSQEGSLQAVFADWGDI